MSSRNITYRFAPLYVGMFFQGMVFAYGIEKIFMNSLGANNLLIAITLVVYSFSTLAFEFTSGVLSDRWSRKGVLLLAMVLLTASSIVTAISQDMLMYMFSSFLWGVYAAFLSGVGESIVYDTLQEDYGTTKRYKLYIGHMFACAGLGYFISALLSGFMVEWFGMREVLWLSVPGSIIGFICFLFIREPNPARTEQQGTIREQLLLTVRIITKNKNLTTIVLTCIVIGTLWSIIMELGSLWLLAIAASPIAFGVLNALAGSSIGLSGYIADRFSSNHMVYILLGFLCTQLALLTYVHDVTAIIVVQMILLIIAYAVVIFAEHRVHDAVPSHLRNGALSSISTVTKTFIMAVAFIFGWLADTYSIFSATWLLIIIFGVYAILLIQNRGFDTRKATL